MAVAFTSILIPEFLGLPLLVMPVPSGYSGETILPQPSEAARILPIQGGGANTVVSNDSSESEQPEPEPDANKPEPKRPKTVKLMKGFRVRLPEEYKNEIMNLDFTDEEQRLFNDYLRFNKTFVIDRIKKTEESKKEFYEFWKLFVEKDGTDGFTLMTKLEGRKIQKYMEDIVYAHREYLIQSALRLLRKQDNPQQFKDLTTPSEEEGFLFTEISVPTVPDPTVPASTDAAAAAAAAEAKEKKNDPDYVPTKNDEEAKMADAEAEEDDDYDDEDEDEEDEEEVPEEKIKNILTHIHKKIISVSSSLTTEEKVIILLEFLIEHFDYDDADEGDKENTKSLLKNYLDCKTSSRGKISCELDISRDYVKFTCKTFLETFNEKFNLSNIKKMSYDQDKEVLKWLIEKMYLVSIEKTPAKYKDILKSRLVYFYNRFIGPFLGNIKNLLHYIAGETYSLYINVNHDKLPELPESLHPKKKK